MTQSSDKEKAEGEDIGQTMITGSLWSFGINSIQQILGLAQIIILANFLLPSDFGIMGIALLTIYALDVFSQTGFQQALIHKKADITTDLDAVWTFLVARGLILFMILFLLAQFIADFFGSSEAVPVIQVIGISLILRGLTNIGTIFFLKNLDFKKQFLFRFSGVLTDFLVCVTAVLIVQNVWAMVFGLMAKEAVLLVMSYLFHPYRPRFDLDLKKVRGLSNYGTWVLVSSILVFLILQADDILVGRILGVAALGFYQMAYIISNTPSTEISQIFSRVAFPVYAKMQDELVQLKGLFLRTLKLTALLSFLLIGSLIALAPDITLVFLGEKWRPIIPLVQILVWWGLIRALEEAMGAVFMATGRPRLYSKLQFVQIVIFVIIFYPLITNYGLEGISVAVVCSSVPVLFLAISALRKTIDIMAGEVYPLLYHPLLLAMTGVVVVFVLRYSLFTELSIISFLVLLGAYTFVIILTCYILENFSSYKAVTILRSFFPEKKK